MLEFGISIEQFQTDHLELKPYLHRAALAERPMHWRDIDSLLHGLEDRPESMQLFNNGQIAAHSYLEQSFELGRQRSRINKHRFYSLMEQGATLVLNHIESQSVAAQRLCAAVANFISQPTSGNAYVSFGGKGTFGKHWDTHDVFAVQLLGRKRWQVFAPTLPLPLPHQTSELMQHTPPAVAVLDCVLNTGDLLYIPRGWWHQVTPLDEGSLHLSIGSYGPSVSDYLQWAIARKLSQRSAARHGVHGALDAPQLTALMQDLTHILLEPNSLAEFRRELATRERLNNEFDLDLFVNTPNRSLEPSDRVLLTCCHPIDASASEIRINGGRMQLAPLSRAILQLLAMLKGATVGEIQAQLPKVPTSAVHAAIVDLARYEVLSIKRRDV